MAACFANMAFRKSVAVIVVAFLVGASLSFAQGDTTPTAKSCGNAAAIIKGPIASGIAERKRASDFLTGKVYPSAAARGVESVAQYKLAARCYALQSPRMCAESNEAADEAGKSAKIVDDAATAQAKESVNKGVTDASTQAAKDVAAAKAAAKACSVLDSSSPGMGGYASVIKMVVLAAVIAVWYTV